MTRTVTHDAPPGLEFRARGYEEFAAAAQLQPEVDRQVRWLLADARAEYLEVRAAAMRALGEREPIDVTETLIALQSELTAALQALLDRSQRAAFTRHVGPPMVAIAFP